MTTKTNWAIDPQHSVLNFKVKHLAIANVSGVFKVLNGSVENESEDFDNAEVSFEVDTKSIDTNHSERDKNLKSELFLNTEKFPTILFNGFIRKTNQDYNLDGELTLLEVTKKIQMNVAFGGLGKGFNKETKAGFEISGIINRKDFGLNIHILNDTGDLVIGNEVKLHCDIELTKQIP